MEKGEKAAFLLGSFCREKPAVEAEFSSCLLRSRAVLESEGSPLPPAWSKSEKPFGRILLFCAGDDTFGDPFAAVGSFSAVLRFTW